MPDPLLLSLLSLLLIKPLLILLVVVIIAWLMRGSSAAREHFVLALGVFAVPTLTLLHGLLPTIEWQLGIVSPQRWALNGWAEYTGALGGLNPGWLVLTVYLLVALWLLFYLVLGIAQVRSDCRRAKPCRDPVLLAQQQSLCEALGIDQPVGLVIDPQVDSPFMWGWRRPLIVLPAHAQTWCEERKLAVLTHELAHVARGDWLVSIAVRLCLALFWFLPPIWWLAARLHHCAELASDDCVYRLHGKNIAYAETLLALSGSVRDARSRLPVLSMARRSPIFYRIQALLDRHRVRYPLTHRVGQYGVLTLVAVLLPMASIKAVPPVTASAPMLRIETGSLLQPDSSSQGFVPALIPPAPADYSGFERETLPVAEGVPSAEWLAQPPVFSVPAIALEQQWAPQPALPEPADP